jgi:integrase
MAANKLTDRVIRQTTTPGIHADGDGLYLQVTASRSGEPRRSWFVRLRLPGGKSRDMGLGRVDLVPLKTARELARAARQEAKAGRDPIAAKEAAKVAAASEQARSITFRQCAEAYIAKYAPGWRNVKHGRQWASTLATYAYPVFGDLPVGVIDTPLIMKVLDPIWTHKTETGSRIRGRIEAILDWARVRGYRTTGENPARWKGNLAMALPARDKAKPQGRHAALPFGQMPAFWVELEKREGVGPLALRFAILTAARTGEVIGARWEEFNFDKTTWIVPAVRMKGAREHRVPLSSHALTILEEIGPKESGPVFPGTHGDKPLSNMALLMALRRMNRADLTTHGFRSSFRDWVAETTDFPGELAEAALAHAVGDRVVAAYLRGDLFEKRRKLMEEWGAYCTSAIKVRAGVAATYVALGRAENQS